jgi:hypothetical protein
VLNFASLIPGHTITRRLIMKKLMSGIALAAAFSANAGTTDLPAGTTKYEFEPKLTAGVGVAIDDCDFVIKTNENGKPLQILADCEEARTDLSPRYGRTKQAWVQKGDVAPPDYLRVGYIPKLSGGTIFRYAGGRSKLNVFTDAAKGDDGLNVPSKEIDMNGGIFPIDIRPYVGGRAWEPSNIGVPAEISKGICVMEYNDNGELWTFDGKKHQGRGGYVGCGNIETGEYDAQALIVPPVLNR